MQEQLFFLPRDPVLPFLLICSSSLFPPPFPFSFLSFSLFLLSFFSVFLVLMLKRCSERRHPCLASDFNEKASGNGHRHSYRCFLSSPEIPFIPNLHFFLFKVEWYMICVYHVLFPIHPLMDTWVASIFWLLWIMLLWTWVCT